MNNKQSSVTELYNKMMQYVPIEYHELVREEIPLGQYEAMHKEEIEASYSDGYKEGYNRAIELTKWTISNLTPPHNEQQ